MVIDKMLRKKNCFVFGLVFSFFLMLIFINSTFATVEVFSNYDTVLKVNDDNTILVNRTLTLKNIYNVGIVPGQIEFKIAKGVDGSVNNLIVSDIVAKDRFGKDIVTNIRETEDYTVIILDIYYPLLPGFEYKFDLSYKLSYDPGGIFFKSLYIPIRESTIPIEKGKFKVILPKNYHFTYLGLEGVDVDVQGNIVVWEIENNMPNSIVFEYSYIPLKFKSIKGSYVFWITINLILFLIVVFEVRREIKKVKNRKHGHNKRS